jgi:cytoskeletal protein CcmA (bactofilin family)
MKKTSIDGVGSLCGSNYEEILVDGVGKLKDDVKAKIIRADGVFKSKWRIEAVSFFCDGVARIYDYIKVKELKVDGVLKIRRGNAESDSICCDGMVTCSGEISADNVNIYGIYSITALYGDEIKLKHDSKRITANISMPKYIYPFIKSYFN